MTKPCPEFETLLLDRAGGSLDASAAARLEAHLAACEACRAEAAALAAALSAARMPPPSEAEERALERARVATLRHWRGAEGSRRNRSLMQGFSAGFAVAAAAAVLVIAPGAYRRVQQAGAAPDDAAAVPEESASALAGSATAETATWEPDLDAVWETAALAMGEATGDEEPDSAWSYTDLTSLDDQ